MKTECSMSYGRLDNVCEMWLFVFGCFVLLRNKISLNKITEVSHPLKGGFRM